MDTLNGKIGMKTKLMHAEGHEHFLAFSRTFSRIPHLSIFLGGEVSLAGLRRRVICTAVAGWGHKPRADKARRYAAKRGLPYVAVEDGFLRSVSLGSTHSRPYSLVLDKSSLYFNAEEQSDLEKLLATYDFTQAPELLQRAEQLIAFQREFGISKYNLSSESPLPGNILFWKKTSGF